MGAEKPATRETGVLQVGHFQGVACWESGSVALPSSIALMHILQNWWLQGRTLGFD
jgi:hypothetical protein